MSVPDLDQGLDFDRDRLGHDLIWRNDELGQAGLRLPDSETELVLSTSLQYAPNWLVTSVQDAVADIVAAGGAVAMEPCEIPVGSLAVVTDPFVNALILLWEVVDAFLSAARGGNFDRLLGLLAPDVVVTGDALAVAMGTPERIDGRQDVADFFNGAAKAARPVFVEHRPGAAWLHHGETKVAFDFTVLGGVVARIEFRAEPAVLALVRSRKGSKPIDRGARD